MLSRSNTWPVVVVRLDNDGKATSKLDANFNNKNQLLTLDPLPSEAHIDPKKEATLFRHYYTEGGWGWVVLVASVLVHILNHGLQLSSGILVVPTAVQFNSLRFETGIL